MATEEYDFEFSLKSKVIKRLFDKSKFAMSSEETRYYLNKSLSFIFSSAFLISKWGDGIKR